jgi:uncharacterized protein (TIGR04222 family)
MDILFNNPIANMSGPAFLALFFGLTIVSVLVFNLLKRSFDWTSKMPIPNIPHEIDPFEIAYLRGGENELTRSVVFSLTKKGFLEITNEAKTSFISQTKTQPNWTELSQIERNVLPFFQITRETKDIFTANGLVSIVAPFATVCKSKANLAHFLTPEEVKSKTKIAALIFAGLIAFLAVYKLYLAFLGGISNVLFLVVFLVISIVVFGMMSKTSRLSSLGKKYLESLQTAFDRLKNINGVANNQFVPQTTFGAIDPTLLAVGIFGTGILAGSAYGDYEQAFHRSSANSSGCGSGCGSSCSSSSGDGGDGGDGGGGDGGGCGGCGGGCS